MQSHGATLVAITPATMEHAKASAEKNRLKFPVLSDEGLGVAASFGLVFDVPDQIIEIYRGFGIDLDAHNGTGGWRLPIPARYVIDTSGVIRKADVDPDYTSRPEPSDTVAFLSTLS